jgi:hypothetical protein
VRRTPEFLLLGVISLRQTEKCFHKRPKHSQAIEIDRSGDCVERANVGGLDTFEHCDVAAVNVLVEACKKRTSVATPIVDRSMYLQHLLASTT